ncbi:response regulator transcription factor [Cohnella yongneupensis]|uniref:Response regulator n=1 Tax=Cohnella yongneupensis TaxID=425006 RepID=A0ABW0R1E4_9BACL
MRYNVLIVDDEPMIRLGLSSSVRWEEEGFELVGEAANGEAALRIAEQQEIHVLITDIKMPLMDGLELTKRLSESYPKIKVVLVSSYSDFDYARKAVKLGVVVDYILKPTMEPVDLLRIMRVCKIQLDETSARLHESGYYMREAEKSKSIELEASLRKVWSGEKIALSSLPEWLDDSLVLVVWRLESASPGDKDSALERILNIQTTKDNLKQWCEQVLSFDTDQQEFVTILPDHQGSAGPIVEKLHLRLLSEGICYTVGISPSFRQIQYMPDAYLWAGKALEQAFFLGKGKLYMGKISARPNREPKRTEEDEQWISLRERFSQMLAVSNKEGSERIIEQCIAMWMNRTLSRKEIIVQSESLLTLMWTGNFRINTEETIRLIIEKLQEVKQLDSLAELCQFIRYEFRTLWEDGRLPLVVADSGSTHAIQLAISYIQQRYHGELSLQEVANHVHMSKNYFSEQFKRLAGVNFIDFVIRLRIQYAKQLLNTTTLRVYDIGVKVGFNSSKHFLKLFKREVNCTPAEYRQLHFARQKQGSGEVGEVSETTPRPS